MPNMLRRADRHLSKHDSLHRPVATFVPAPLPLKLKLGGQGAAACHLSACMHSAGHPPPHVLHIWNANERMLGRREVAGLQEGHELIKNKAACRLESLGALRMAYVQCWTKVGGAGLRVKDMTCRYSILTAGPLFVTYVSCTLHGGRV